MGGFCVSAGCKRMMAFCLQVLEAWLGASCGMKTDLVFAGSGMFALSSEGLRPVGQGLEACKNLSNRSIED